MASTEYTAQTVSGTVRRRRVVDQGAPKKPDELKRNCREMIALRQSEHAEYLEAAQASGMSKAAFGGFAVMMYIKLSATNKC